LQQEDYQYIPYYPNRVLYLIVIYYRRHLI